MYCHESCSKKKVTQKTTPDTGQRPIQRVKTYLVHDFIEQGYQNYFQTHGNLKAMMSQAPNLFTDTSFPETALAVTRHNEMKRNPRLSTPSALGYINDGKKWGDRPPLVYKKLKSDERLILFGHGSTDNFGGYTPHHLAKYVSQYNLLPANYSGDIYLDGCNTGTEIHSASYARKFIQALLRTSGKMLGLFSVTGNIGETATQEDGFETKDYVKINISNLPQFNENYKRYAIDHPDQRKYSPYHNLSSAEDIPSISGESGRVLPNSDPTKKEYWVRGKLGKQRILSSEANNWPPSASPSRQRVTALTTLTKPPRVNQQTHYSGLSAIMATPTFFNL